MNTGISAYPVSGTSRSGSVFAFLAFTALFCTGYFLPWVSVNMNFLGLIQVHSQEDANRGAWILLLIAALIAGGMALYELMQPHNRTVQNVRAFLAAGCLGFAAYLTLYHLVEATGILRFSYGLPILLLGAVGMAATSREIFPVVQRHVFRAMCVGALVLALPVALFTGIHDRKEVAQVSEIMSDPGKALETGLKNMGDTLQRNFGGPR